MDQLNRDTLSRRLEFLVSAVDAACQELAEGQLSFRARETLARDITAVRAEIGALTRRLETPGPSFNRTAPPQKPSLMTVKPTS